MSPLRDDRCEWDLPALDPSSTCFDSAGEQDPVDDAVELSCTAENGRRPKRLAPEAAARLQHYDWSGNVRELRNVIERLMIMVPGDTITAQDLASVTRLTDVYERRLHTGEHVLHAPEVHVAYDRPVFGMSDVVLDYAIFLPRTRGTTIGACCAQKAPSL